MTSFRQFLSLCESIDVTINVISFSRILLLTWQRIYFLIRYFLKEQFAFEKKQVQNFWDTIGIVERAYQSK